MTYFRPLSGADSCGADQVFDPAAVFNGIKGQCMPRKEYAQRAGCTPLEMVASVGTTPYNACSQKIAQSIARTSGQVPSLVSSLFGALTGAIGTSTITPAGPVYAPQPAGMSTVTKVAIAGGAIALIAVLARR